MRSRRRTGPVRRVSAALLAALAVLVALAGCGEPEQAPPAPLRILLVNDDGWAAPGIVAVRTALRRAGHRVVEVAPMRDGGSAGTAVTTTGELRVLSVPAQPDVWTVAGTPSDATLVALRALMRTEAPDLVVVGINPERSVGLGVLQSGTVGAAVTAAGVGFPALAVSTEVADLAGPRPSEFAGPADFTVRLVAAMTAQRIEGAPLMPTGTVLNVNYPGGPAAPREIVAAPTADTPTTDVRYRFGGSPRTFVPRSMPLPPTGGDNDASALASGHVTLTDLSANPDRASPPPRTAARLANVLAP